MRFKKNQEMKAAVFLEPGKLELRKRKVPDVPAGAVLLKVRSCAICGSDLRIFRHGNERVKGPRILGHEISGEVAVIGEGVQRFRVGERVSVGADIPCGKCTHCIQGRPNCCDTNLAIGYQFDGGFAEYILLDPLVVSLGPIQTFSDDIGFDSAALAEPLACCINGYERGLMAAGKSVVIFGAGPIGLMLAMLAPVYGARQVIMIDPLQKRLDWAKLAGASEVINPKTEEPIQRVLALTQGSGADLVFTACPVAETHEQAIAMVAKRGVVNLFGGLPKSAPPISVLSNHLHYREAYLTGSHGSTPKQHKEAVQLLEKGQINTDLLISDHYNLDAVESGFAKAMSGDGLKVVIKPND